MSERPVPPWNDGRERRYAQDGEEGRCRARKALADLGCGFLPHGDAADMLSRKSLWRGRFGAHDGCLGGWREGGTYDE